MVVTWIASLLRCLAVRAAAYHTGATTSSYPVDPNWYADTAATDHLANDLNKLTTKEQYHGKDNVQTANGTGDAHKYRGLLKSSLGSITQIYSSTRWEHKNINKTLAIEASLSTTPVYQ